MEKMGCWDVLDIERMPDGCVPIGCKWVLKLKFRDGVYDKHRARLVALGYMQEKGRDFYETFSPTCNHVSIRLILALTAMPGWQALDLDAEAAFVSSVLGDDEVVYMKIPPGFTDHYGKGKVLRLRRSLYGLCQSPLNYYKLVQEVYEKAGLKRLKADECVFVRYENNVIGGPSTLSNEDLLKQGYFLNMKTVPVEKRIYKSCPHSVAALIVAVYVDNNACRFNCIELVEEFEAFLKADGRIKMLREGKLEWLLGVRYYFDEKTGAVSCNQKSNIENILNKYGMRDCNAAPLPMSPSADLESLPTETIDPAVIAIYSSLIGELLYIAINTVPHISYVMSALTRYMTRATESHLKYAKMSYATSRESWIEELRGAPIIVEIRISVTRFGHVPTAVTRIASPQERAQWRMGCSSTTQFSRGNLACRQLLQHPRVRQSSWPIARALARCCMRAS